MVLWKHLSFCLLHKIFYKFNNSIFCLHLLSFLGPDFLLIINLSQGNCFLFGAKQLFLILVFCLFFSFQLMSMSSFVKGRRLQSMMFFLYQHTQQPNTNCIWKDSSWVYLRELTDVLLHLQMIAVWLSYILSCELVDCWKECHVFLAFVLILLCFLILCMSECLCLINTNQ